MVINNDKAMGVIFPNLYDKLVPDLVNVRLMASIPFASRYRMIDFTLSSMVNSGIDNITVLVQNNYHSLMDHLGSGVEWDLARRQGGLRIFPPYSEKGLSLSNGRIDSLYGIMLFLKAQTEKYVVLSDTNIAYNMDFKKVIDAHIASKADVTMIYSKEELPESALTATDTSKGLYYTLELDENEKVTDIIINSQDKGIQNYCMNVYIMDRELLIEKIDIAFKQGMTDFERDVLLKNINELNIVGYHYSDYIARIDSIKGFFDQNMKLLDDKNLDALFSKATIYTKVRDDNPTRYIGDASVTNVMVADGCVIEGELENCVLFRGVKIGKGVKAKNCIFMQDTVVEDNVEIEYVITDKQVTISEGKSLKGEDAYPFYISKWKTI